MIKAALLVLLPAVMQAGGWEVFEARCLTPYEAQFPPIVEGLEPAPSRDGTAGYWLATRDKLIVELAPDDGFSACHLIDFTGTSEVAFDAWIARAVLEGRYEKVGDNLWHSFEWIEPVVAVQKHRNGAVVTLRVLETDLES